jgi:iron complex transport system permease protein
MFADLLSRMAYTGVELPVGAITSIIGVPVFAYLLIRRGRMYDG